MAHNGQVELFDDPAQLKRDAVAARQEADKLYIENFALTERLRKLHEVAEKRFGQLEMAFTIATGKTPEEFLNNEQCTTEG